MPRFLARFVVVAAGLLFVARGAHAEGAFGAPIGPWPVGYRGEWITDEARRFDVPDAEGALHASPRHVRVHLWYPSVRATGTAMALGDYFGAGRADGVPRFVIDRVRANDFGTPGYSFRSIFKSDTLRLAAAMRTPMRARAWARPAAGRFPVVVHVVGQNDFTQDAVLFAEYLASCGYVVVTVPYMGTSARRTPLLVHDPSFYENLLRDLELALDREALRLPCADPARVFATGHSYGGIYALLLAMRSHTIRGVIGLDPTYAFQRAAYEYDLRKFPFWDPTLAIPVVTLHRAAASADTTLLSALGRSPRLVVTYDKVLHGDYASVPFWKRDLPDSMQLADEIAVRSPREAVVGARHVFEQVRRILDALSAGRTAQSAVSASASIPQAVAVLAPRPALSAEELYWIDRQRGLPAAEAAAAQLAPSEEPALVAAAKEEGYYGHADAALDLLRLLRAAFPRSATAQLAAANGLRDAGQRGEALAAARSAVAIDPKLPGAQELVDELQAPK